MAEEKNGERKQPKHSRTFDLIADAIIFAALRAWGVPNSKSSSKNADTEQQIANWTAAVAEWTKKLVFWTRWIVGVGVATAVVLAIQTGIFINQLTEMRDENRPWVYAKSAEPWSPFTVDNDGGRIVLAFNLTNTGKFPAQFVNIGGDFSYIQIPDLTNGRQIYSKRKACDDLRAKVMPGDTVFPGQSTTMNHWFAMTAANVAEWKAEKPTEHGGLWIVGCIDYVFSFGATHHQTHFIYQLERPGQNEGFSPVEPFTGQILPGDLRLANNPNLVKDAD